MILWLKVKWGRAQGGGGEGERSMECGGVGQPGGINLRNFHWGGVGGGGGGGGGVGGGGWGGGGVGGVWVVLGVGFSVEQAYSTFLVLSFQGLMACAISNLLKE